MHCCCRWCWTVRPWVSRSQSQSRPPASCWNQRNHKNVTASVIIPPCCLTACPRKQWLPIAFSLSYTHTHFFMSDRHTFSQGVDAHFTHAERKYRSTYTNILDLTPLVPLFFPPLRNGVNPRLSDAGTDKNSHRPKTGTLREREEQ